MSSFPKGATLVLAGARTSEAAVICFIMPFVNQMVAGFGVSSASSARYAGLIESALIVTEAISSPFWGILADKRGRKPLMVLGLAAFSLACIAIGLSRTLLQAVLARCISGILGAVAVLVRTVQFEIADSDHVGRVLEWLTPCWALGAALGPMIGGGLAEPAKTMPHLFEGTVFETFPYLLPSIVTAILPGITAFAALFWLPETLGNAVAEPQCDASPVVPIGESTSLVQCPYINGHTGNTPGGTGYPEDSCDEVQPGYGDLIGDWGLVYTLICSAALSFVSMAYNASFMMMASTPLTDGGLGMESWKLGLLLATSSILGVIVAAFVTPIFTRKLGWYRALRLTSLAHVALFPLIAVTGIVARWEGKVGGWTGAVILCVLVCYELGEISFTGIDVVIADRSPKGCLASVNGLSLSSASLGRMLAPVMSGQLWAASVESTIIGGHQMIWLVFTILALVWWHLTLRLTPDGPSVLLDLESGQQGYGSAHVREVKQANERDQLDRLATRSSSLETLFEEPEGLDPGVLSKIV